MTSQELPRLAIRLGGALWSKSQQKTSLLSGAAAKGLSSLLGCPTSNSTLGNLRPVQHVRFYADLPAHTLMNMPSLSPTMTSGNIVSWKKKEGDQVAPGQILAEVETDKATIEWEGQEEGYIAKILKPDGSKDIEIGAPVAVLVEDEGSVAAFKDYAGEGAPAKAAPKAAPAAKPAAAPAGSKPAAPAQTKPAAPKSNFPPHQIMTMPSLSPTMNQGNIIEWKKKVGDSVAPGEVYCEVETDKSTISWESMEDGFIAQILMPDGSKDIPVGAPVMVVVEDKELVGAFKDFKAADASGGKSEPAQAEAAPAPEANNKPAPAAAKAETPKSAPAQASSSGDRIRASPYAKKVAAQSGISLEGITGTGPDGRIVAEDVQKAAASGSGAAKPKAAAPTGAAAAAKPGTAPAGPPATHTPSTGDYQDIPHSQIKRVTAARLTESKQTIPHYYLSMECQVDAMMKLREQINTSQAKAGVKISVNDFVIKAAALALKKVSGVNASWNKDFVRQFSNVDISIAVQTPNGLQVPIVFGADSKGLGAISSDVKALAAKAKEGKLKPAEFMGGTFTISNLGMYGIKQFAAIVNPPQAAILAVGGSDKKVVAKRDGSGYEEVTTITVTLSCDHRVVDGAMGAEWLQAFKGFLENPYTMML